MKNRIIAAVSWLVMVVCLLPTRGSAAGYELIPSWKRLDHTVNGDIYNYRVFYVDNESRRMFLCFASFELSNKKLSLSCGAEINLNWKLPSSPNVRTLMVGKFDIEDDDPNIAFGLWQIDEATGDWQFCLDANLAGNDDCVFAKKPSH